VIVGLIEFTGGPDEEHLPPPLNPEAVMSRSLTQRAPRIAPTEPETVAVADGKPAAAPAEEEMDMEVRRILRWARSV